MILFLTNEPLSRKEQGFFCLIEDVKLSPLRKLFLVKRLNEMNNQENNSIKFGLKVINKLAKKFQTVTTAMANTLAT